MSKGAGSPKAKGKRGKKTTREGDPATIGFELSDFISETKVLSYDVLAVDTELKHGQVLPLPARPHCKCASCFVFAFAQMFQGTNNVHMLWLICCMCSICKVLLQKNMQYCVSQPVLIN